MPRVFSDYLQNVNQSIVYFLKNETYTKGNETKTLKDFLVAQGEVADLPIVIGWPPVIDRLLLPSMALVTTIIPPAPITFFGTQTQEWSYAYTLHGFVGGFSEDHKNVRLRDRLLNDVVFLLTQTEQFPVYQLAPDNTVDTSLRVNDAMFDQVSGREIPSSGTLAVDRWRFAVDFRVSIFRAFDT